MTPTTLLGLAVATAATTALVSVPVAADAATQVQKLATSYVCTSSFGSGETTVGVQTRLPASVKAGRSVPSKRADLLIVVPEALVDTFRKYGVQSISGTASKASLKVGTRSVALSGLKIPATPVPESGSMVLPASGTNAAFTFTKPGARTVTAPASFAAHVVGATSDSSYPLDLTCGLPKGADAKLSTLRVVR